MIFQYAHIGQDVNVRQNETFIFVNNTSEPCQITGCEVLTRIPMSFAAGESQFATVKPGATKGPHDYTHTCGLHKMDNPKIIVGG